MENLDCPKELVVKMQEDIDKLKDKVGDIYDALIGTEFNPGFKQRIEVAEIKADKTDRKVNGIYIYGSALASIIVILGVLFKIGII